MEFYSMVKIVRAKPGFSGYKDKISVHSKQWGV